MKGQIDVARILGLLIVGLGVAAACVISIAAAVGLVGLRTASSVALATTAGAFVVSLIYFILSDIHARRTN